MKSYAKFKSQILRNREIKKSYDELGPEFEIIALLIRRRLERGFSQGELAERIGTKQSSISRFESGTYNPTLDFLQKVAEGLGSKLKISVGTK